VGACKIPDRWLCSGLLYQYRNLGVTHL
jgi:hypothetical protein